MQQTPRANGQTRQARYAISSSSIILVLTFWNHSDLKRSCLCLVLKILFLLSQNEVNSVCNYKSTSDTLTALVPTLDPTSPFCKDTESLGTHLSAHKSTTLDGYMSQQRQTASMLGVGGEEAGHGGGGAMSPLPTMRCTCCCLVGGCRRGQRGCVG